MEKIVEEALRYLGAPGDRGGARRAAEEAAALVKSQCPPRGLYRVFPLEQGPSGVEMPQAGLTLPGALARRMLGECGAAALLICTLGAGFDRLLFQAQRRDMAWAVVLDACGSAAVEAACDDLEAEIARQFPGRFLTDRFSPGYGDLPLDLQRAWTRALDGERRLGVTATDACLLRPQKTVTAAVGLADRPQPARVRGCKHCALQDGCAYRKRGTTCGI